MSMTSRAPSPGPAAYPKANRESATTKAADWHAAKTRGERLPEHELRCERCGEPSEPPVCALCVEDELCASINS